MKHSKTRSIHRNRINTWIRESTIQDTRRHNIGYEKAQYTRTLVQSDMYASGFSPGRRRVVESFGDDGVQLLDPALFLPPSQYQILATANEDNVHIQAVHMVIHLEVCI